MLVVFSGGRVHMGSLCSFENAGGRVHTGSLCSFGKVNFNYSERHQGIANVPTTTTTTP